MSIPVVTMENISFAYEEKTILENVNLEISRGAFMGLVGPNGGGKTTLIKLILGLEQPNQGSIRILNEPIRQFRNWNKLGFVSQKANAFNRGFPATVFEVVSMGLTAKVGYFKFLNQKHKEKIMQAIDQVGMLEYAKENKIGRAHV